MRQTWVAGATNMMDTPTKFCFQTWQVLICLCLVENKQRTLNMLTLNQIEIKAGLKDKDGHTLVNTTYYYTANQLVR